MIEIYIIYNLFLVYLFLLYNKKLFTYLEYQKLFSVILIVLIIIKSYFNLYNSFVVNFVLSCLIYLSISFLFFKGSVTKKILFVGFFLISSFTSEIVASLILNPIFIYLNIDIKHFAYNLVGYGTSLLVLISFLYFVTKINNIKDTIDDKVVWYFIVAPVVSIAIIFWIVLSKLLTNNPMLCMIITLCIIIYNLIICFGFADIIESKNNQIELKKLKIQELHYQLLEEKFDNSKKFMHDFKKHLNIITGFVNEHEYTRLERYLKDISEEIRAEDNLVITGNQLIDLSLNANKLILSDNSISIRHEIKINDMSPISDLDFNIIFSNIIENAIESCLRSDGHFIKIKLDRKERYIILKVLNPCSKVNVNLESIKSDSEYHGYGIKNIEKIVRKYKGSCNFNYDRDNNLFISTVILKI